MPRPELLIAASRETMVTNLQRIWREECPPQASVIAGWQAALELERLLERRAKREKPPRVVP